MLFDWIVLFQMSVAELHAGALVHVVLAVASGGPRLAAVFARVRFELEMDPEVVNHVAELRHALAAELADVHLVDHACLVVDGALPFVVLGELCLGVILGGVI